MIEVLISLGTFAAALVLVPVILAVVGAVLLSVLSDRRPELYLSDPAARRRCHLWR